MVTTIARARLWGTMLVWAVALMACGGNSNPPPTLTPQSAPTITNSSTPVAPTGTASPTASATAIAIAIPTTTPTSTPTPIPPNPLSIEYIRQQAYPGGEITIEQTLGAGSNYRRYVTSYKSQGLKIYALLTVPSGTKPATGWPVIIFNHGYIPNTFAKSRSVKGLLW